MNDDPVLQDSLVSINSGKQCYMKRIEIISDLVFYIIAYYKLNKFLLN